MKNSIYNKLMSKVSIKITGNNIERIIRRLNSLKEPLIR